MVLTVVLCISYWWLKPYTQSIKGEANSFLPLLLLIGKIVLFFLTALLAFSMVTALFCWIHFLIVSRNTAAFSFAIEPEAKQRGLWIESILLKARRPLLGFVKARLIYDDGLLTDSFLLASSHTVAGRFWRKGISGKNKLELPDIREYALKGGFVFFEDMLRLIALPVRVPAQGHFHQTPELKPIPHTQVQPKKTEETQIRIEQLRKVEGEYLNYKNFETGDDVRRVVWKVYAKNRDLVVRIPEMFEPYASHLYLYASFANPDFAEGDFASEMLNVYKHQLWSLYSYLSTQEWAVKFIPDQELKTAEYTTEALLVQHQISNCSWQPKGDLVSYFNAGKGSVLCISSFDRPEDVEEVLALADNNTVVYFVKLSEVFKANMPLLWISRLLFLTPDDRLKKLRGRWFLHPMKWKLQKREQLIEQLLVRSNVELLNSTEG